MFVRYTRVLLASGEGLPNVEVTAAPVSVASALDLVFIILKVGWPAIVPGVCVPAPDIAVALVAFATADGVEPTFLVAEPCAATIAVGVPGVMIGVSTRPSGAFFIASAGSMPAMRNA